MYTIENDQLRVSIQARGAELFSIYNKSVQLEYMWEADPAFWNKKSPILFPIVGTLKADTCYVNGTAYKMGRHGFAREMEFAVTENTGSSIRFTITSSEETRQRFPFDFELSITYRLFQDQLQVSYSVLNTGNEEMLFSVGGHPAFRIPLDAASNYSDYYLEFNKTENAGRWPISPDGLIMDHPSPLLANSNKLPLTKELFLNDALVFKGLESTSVKLLNTKNAHGLNFDFTGFPFLGIWAAKHANFVCIEPWCGIADSVSSNQQLADKEGINKLSAGKEFSRTWTAKFF